MKVLILSDANSSHTQKWVNSLVDEGVDVCLFSLSKFNDQLYKNILVVNFGLNKNDINTTNNNISKLKYFKALPIIKNTIKDFKPDILHAHYASSYGLLGALCGFRPFLVSVWGTDVYNFPAKSYFHKLILRFSLSKADRILSTSEVMAIETSKYTSKKVYVTPFGIDLVKFQYTRYEADVKEKNKIIIGTVKTLDPFYGIDVLIEAFSILLKARIDLNLELLIVGGGPLMDKLKHFSKDLEIDKKVLFTGQIPPNEVPEYLNKLDIYAALSNYESFGVAVLEACACEIPVVVSNVGGLPEVVEDGVTGFIVPKNNPKATADVLGVLVADPELRRKLGKAGRERVRKYYDWKSSVNLMLSIYTETLYRNG
jgi:glycosyltransferase involved in cell wall biosynthesis